MLRRNRESEPGRPTEAELRILQVLWTKGPSTVRDVHEQLRDAKDTGYTTTLKLLQTMHAKGLVRRNDEARAHVFEAVSSREEAQRGLVGDVLDLAFGGSAKALVMNALASGRPSAQDLDEIRQEIERLQREAKG
ncbi:MAG: BlaI/MecI/CopY family transcriptional regulator [Fimbriimonadaceae bacterium]|nr:BlaI/MecI/CopY family transcriptional regulator [Fimbriimonadaceae bacterium]